MRFPTCYPEGLSKDQYITSIISKYTEMNNVYSFSLEQIEIPIRKVIGFVTHVIEEYSNPEYKLAKINLFKKFIEDQSYFPRDFLEFRPDYISLYWFIKGGIAASRVELKNRKIPFPAEQEKVYVTFTQQMSQEVTMGICNATENLIYVLQGQDKENIPFVSENTSANLSQSKKSVRFFKETIDVKSDDVNSVGIVNNFV